MLEGCDEALQGLSVDTGARVGDFDLNAARIAPCTNVHLAALGREFQNSGTFNPLAREAMSWSEPLG